MDMTDKITLSRAEYDQICRDRAAYLTALRTIYAATLQGAGSSAILKMIDLSGVKP